MQQKKQSVWYKDNWINIFNNGGCMFYLFEGDMKINSLDKGIVELFH